MHPYWFTAELFDISMNPFKQTLSESRWLRGAGKLDLLKIWIYTSDFKVRTMLYTYRYPWINYTRTNRVVEQSMKDLDLILVSNGIWNNYDFIYGNYHDIYRKAYQFTFWDISNEQLHDYLNKNIKISHLGEKKRRLPRTTLELWLSPYRIL